MAATSVSFVYTPSPNRPFKSLIVGPEKFLESWNAVEQGIKTPTPIVPAMSEEDLKNWYADMARPEFRKLAFVHHALDDNGLLSLEPQQIEQIFEHIRITAEVFGRALFLPSCKTLSEAYKLWKPAAEDFLQLHLNNDDKVVKWRAHTMPFKYMQKFAFAWKRLMGTCKSNEVQKALQDTRKDFQNMVHSISLESSEQFAKSKFVREIAYEYVFKAQGLNAIIQHNEAESLLELNQEEAHLITNAAAKVDQLRTITFYFIKIGPDQLTILLASGKQICVSGVMLNEQIQKRPSELSLMPPQAENATALNQEFERKLHAAGAQQVLDESFFQTPPRPPQRVAANQPSANLFSLPETPQSDERPPRGIRSHPLNRFRRPIQEAQSGIHISERALQLLLKAKKTVNIGEASLSESQESERRRAMSETTEPVLESQTIEMPVKTAFNIKSWTIPALVGTSMLVVGIVLGRTLLGNKKAAI